MSSKEPKKIKRSRLGCHRCKRLKTKCSEEKPSCASCLKARVQCDYSIKLTWGGRPYKDASKRNNSPGARNFSAMEMTHSTSSMATSMSRNSTIEFVPSDFSPGENTASPIKIEDSPKTAQVFENNATTLNNSPVVSQQYSAPVANDSFQPQLLNDIPSPHYNDWASVIGIRSSPGISTDTTNINFKPEIPAQNHKESGSGFTPITSPRDTSGFSNPQPPSITTPELLPMSKEIPDIASPVMRSPLGIIDSDFTDSFSADLARIERAFPPEQRSPFYQNSFTYSSPRKNSFDPEIMELELASALSHSPQKSAMLMQKRDEFLQSAASQCSIPPQLAPLPEILLKVPYYRQLFQFWIDVAADNLVPAPYLYTDNPFKKILPQMAMHYPGLLTTLLAFAAQARDDLEGSSGTHKKIIDQLLGRSCDELLKQLQDKSESTSDGTFAMSLFLSSFEVVHSNDLNKHRAHAIGASQIMTARTRKLRRTDDSPSSLDDEQSSVSTETSLTRRNESDIAFFLSRWFVYLDIIGALSSTRDRLKYLQAYRNPGSYSPVKNIPYMELDDTERDIDFILGFDPKFLPHFVNISLLIDEVEKYMERPGSDPSCIPQYIIFEALELKVNMQKSYAAGEEKRSLIIDELIEKNRGCNNNTNRALVDKDNILRSTNKLYFNTGLLNLYRRVLLLPRSSQLVQNLVSEMTEIFEFFIEPHSTAQICTIFSLFCSGCDNLDVSKKDFYRKRFSQLIEQKNMNAVKALMVMDRCWETGEDWITAANILDIDLVLM